MCKFWASSITWFTKHCRNASVEKWQLKHSFSVTLWRISMHSFEIPEPHPKILIFLRVFLTKLKQKFLETTSTTAVAFLPLFVCFLNPITFPPLFTFLFLFSVFFFFFFFFFYFFFFFTFFFFFFFFFSFFV